MTSSWQLPRRTRRLVPVVVIVLGLVLISAVMIRQVAAQGSDGLKPPFKLIKPANLAEPLSGVPPLPLNAPIVMSQTFDSSFVLNVNYNFNVNNTSVPWHLVNASGVVDNSYTWGRVAGAPLTDTLWNAATTPPSGTPISAGQPYTKNMQAYAIYGPINMLDYASAFISVTYVIDTLDGDLFGVAFSTNGTDFTMPAGRSGRASSLSTNNTDYYLFPDNVKRQRQVWIALVFTSQNRDNIDALGVFVKNVVLRANPTYKIYLPVMRLDPTPTPTSTPTPTPTPAAVPYTFGTGASNDPDYVAWGGGQTASNCGGVACTYGQGNVTGGNPGGAMTIYMRSGYAAGGTGPNIASPTNFEYSADLMLYNGQKDGRYGLIFDASNGAFGPLFDSSRNYYKLKLHTSTGQRNHVISYQLQQCVNGSCGALNTETNLPYEILVNEWHNVKITQINTTITFYLDNQALVSVPFDGTWDDGGLRRKFGIYVETKEYIDTSNAMQIYFDNVRITQK